MTQPVITVRSTETLDDVVTTMEKYQLRRATAFGGRTLRREFTGSD